MAEKQQRETILVNGYVYPSVDPGTLRAWLPDLTFVSTFSYGFTPDGQLIDLMDESIISTAQSAGVQSLMVLAPLDSQGVDVYKRQHRAMWSTDRQKRQEAIRPLRP